MKKIAIYLFLLIFTFELQSQTVLDSLESIVNNTPENEKIAKAISISESFINKSLQTSLYFAKLSHKMSIERDNEYFRAVSGKLLGKILLGKGNFDEAGRFLDSAYKYFEINNRKKDLCETLILLGDLNIDLSRYDIALEFYNNALKNADNDDLLSMSLNNIGLVYLSTEENEQAMEYFDKAIKLESSVKDKTAISDAYGNMAVLYENEKKYDEALRNYLKSIEIEEASGRINDAAMNYISIGDLYRKKKEYDKSKEYIEKGMAISRNSGNKPTELYGYRFLTLLYKETGKFKEALESSERISELQSSIFNDNTLNMIAEDETRNGIERRDKEIQLLQEKNSTLKEQRIIIIIASGLFLLIIFILIIQIYKRRLLNRKLDALNKELTENNLKLKESEEKLNKSNSEKDKLFSVISHDLKGPFSGFLGISKIISDDIDNLTRPEISELSQALYSSLYNQYKLLDNLLQWSKLQLGRFFTQIQEIEVCNRINDMIELFLPNAKKKEIEIISDCKEKMVIKSDQNIFTLVLQNLISNSIKFTGEKGTIIIKAYFEEKYAIFEINDNGIGMKPEKIQAILNAEAGISSLGTDGEGGTGLGLSLSRELISKINGKLEITSNYGVGTSAKVYFPLENQ